MTQETSRGSARIWLGGGCVIAVAALGLVLMTTRQQKALAKETNARETELKQGPVIKAVKAGMSSGNKGLVLVGEARPYQSVTLYAKTSGYMNKILVDKGDKVHQGQLLATIVSPETDQAYKAALADLENKKKILKRDQALVAKEYISKEDEEASETAVQMAAAQVQSLREQSAYKNLTAPFSGTITARYADPGALVQNATNSQTSAQPVVTLSELDKIRIYAYVSQMDAAYLKEGYPVTITMAEKPDLNIKTGITRIAGELDPKTRMMLIEVDLPNKNDQIIPGSYLQVTIQSPDSKGLSIPTEALVIRGKNYFVPVIDSANNVHYQQVTIGTNDGVHATILSGLEAGQTIGLNAGPGLADGQKVRPQM